MPDPAESPLPFAIGKGSVQLAVRVTARSGRTALGAVVAGVDGRPALAVRLAAPPVDGAANEALRTIIARQVGIARSQVVIRSGEASRLKILDLSGDPAAIAVRLRELIRA
jgi:uncharacterized protein (TIGR00251 family)